jgi:hypothetical protein
MERMDDLGVHRKSGRCGLAVAELAAERATRKSLAARSIAMTVGLIGLFVDASHVRKTYAGWPYTTR